MTTTHVYIVDINTFKLHLEYQFAGTGAKETFVDFNATSTSSLRGGAENNLASMIADGLRIRKGDNIIFYLQSSAQDGIQEGKFYGVFQAANDWSFLDNYGENQYLKRELGKSLTFRTIIEPKEVYPAGVTEWEALDSIESVDKPNEMIWSLIYRKLRGNRGNTMINPYEADRLISLIKAKNDGKIVVAPGYTFDSSNERIAPMNASNSYSGRKEPIDIFPRLKRKYEENKAFESHLQAYIVQNIGKGTNDSLDKTVLEGSRVDWIGNEVYCGVGMQRIDVLIETTNNLSELKIIPIELKAVETTKETVRQINRYIDWLKQYYIPNRGYKDLTIRPIIIGKRYSSLSNVNRFDLINAIRENQDRSGVMIDYFEYRIKSEELHFENVPLTSLQ